MVRRSRYAIIVFLFVWLIHGQNVWAQTVRAFVDRNPITVDETVRLVIEERGQSSGDSPDVSILESDFDVLGNSQSSQTSIMNGRTSSSKQWVITLAPKHAGNVTIPAMTIGGQSSQPLILKVQQVAQHDQGKAARDIFLEATVEPKDPYVQSQILYTLRLYHAVPLREGQIGDPQINGAMVERVGEDQSFETIRDGRRYQVIERRYLVVPQASGPLTIPSILFSGKVPDGRRPRSMLDDMFGNRAGVFGGGFQSARLVRARSAEMTLHVQEIPSDMRNSTWLPARELSVTESWSIESHEVEIGQPITRTITIHAKGLTGEQLPEVTLSENTHLKVYPDQPTITTTFDGSWAVGTREQKLALVPTQPGNLMIPEIRIRWWNLDSRRAEVAVLPARSLTILGLPTMTSSNKGSVSQHETAASTVVEHSPLSNQDTNGIPSSILTRWPWMGSLFFGLWLLTLAAWWYDRRKLRSSENMEKTQNEQPIQQSLRTLRESVKQVCLDNSPKQTREALLKWASVALQGNTPPNFGNVAKHFTHHAQGPSQAQQAIGDLDRTLYAEQDQGWDGKKFWEMVAPEMKILETARGKRKKNNEAALPHLYLHAPSS